MHKMKKVLILSALSVVLFTSCSEDFNVTADWKSIPIVYGLLSLQDTAHYIKVEKAFLDPKKNAYELAKIADSLYYKNLLVQLQDMSSGQLYTMREVDGNNEGYPRTSGPFATAPNIMYKLTAAELPLEGGRNYRLLVQREDGSAPITATTTVLNDFRITTPSVSSKIRIVNNSSTRFQWNDRSGATFYEVYLTLRYEEWPVNNPAARVEKAIRWRVATRVRALQLSFPGTEFYSFVRGQISQDPSVSRAFKQMDVEVVGGGSELYDYVSVLIANQGITSAEEVPNYSNLSEGLGLYSSRTRTIAAGFEVTDETLDSLRNGIYTKALNFQ